MAAVMSSYKKAKYQSYQITQKRIANSGDLGKWRAEYIGLQNDGNKTIDPKMKEDIQRRMVDLVRKIEDKDRELSAMLNTEGSAIISQLYDDIKTVVDKTAEMNGYHIVFAYPDNATPDAEKNALFKEIKLRPTAAYPFFVARHVDITGEVVRRLNATYPAVDERGQKVDVSKLPLPAPPAAPTVPRP